MLLSEAPANHIQRTVKKCGFRYAPARHFWLPLIRRRAPSWVARVQLARWVIRWQGLDGRMAYGSRAGYGF